MSESTEPNKGGHNPILQIELSSALTDAERAVVARYLIQHGQLSAQEWLVAFQAFDLLGNSIVTLGKQRETFSIIYDRIVERKHADNFIDQLLALKKDVRVEGEHLKAIVARTIAQELAEAGLYRADTPVSRYLLAYCYYWWHAFAGGYIFEVQIYQDLKQSRIDFIAHNIRDSIERYSKSDLIILKREGDIKTSTYFLTTARTQTLRHDFYITRLYDERRKLYRVAVIMSEAAWRDIDGNTILAELKEATDWFPQAIQTRYIDKDLVIVEYEVWKQLVKTRQQKEYDG